MASGKADRATCPHDEAHWLPTSVEGAWERVCDRCGLSAYGVSLSEAKRVFEQNAERLRDGRLGVNQSTSEQIVRGPV